MKEYFAMIMTQFHKNVKVVRTDNGTEFVFLKSYFLENSILHQTTIAGTPQQNGRVGLKHRHILNVTCALSFQGNLPKKFLGECSLTTGYLINRTPSSLLQGKTPNELLHGNHLLILILEVLVIFHMFMICQKINSVPEVVFVCFLVIRLIRKIEDFMTWKIKNLLCQEM